MMIPRLVARVSAAVMVVVASSAVFSPSSYAMETGDGTSLVSVETSSDSSARTFKPAQSSEIHASLGNRPHEAGPKTWILRKALQGIARGIRSGGDEFISMARKGKFLDDQAERVLRRNNRVIANAIDDVAELPDLAGHVIREKLFDALRGPIGAGNAKLIADAVAGVLWVVL